MLSNEERNWLADLEGFLSRTRNDLYDFGCEMPITHLPSIASTYSLLRDVEEAVELLESDVIEVLEDVERNNPTR